MRSVGRISHKYFKSVSVEQSMQLNKQKQKKKKRQPGFVVLAWVSKSFISFSKVIEKLGERPTILDSHSDKVLKDFIDQKRDEKMYKKVWSDISVYNTINREEIRRSRGWYSVPTTTSPNLFPVDGVVHRNIGSDFFVHLFVSLLVNKQWPIGYGVGLRIKRSSVRIRPWPLRWVLGQGSLLPLSQGEAFTLASISYLAILVKYILAKKKKKKKNPLKW